VKFTSPKQTLSGALPSALSEVDAGGLRAVANDAIFFLPLELKLDHSMKIAIIGGGNMGGAIAKGIAAGSLVPASDLTVTAHTQQTLDKIKGYDPAIRTTLDNREAVQGADLVVLAVKPWLLEEVVKEIRGGLDYRKQAVASVIGRSSFEELGKLLDNGSGVMPVMYRIIPNTAISLGESVTFIAEQGAPKKRLDELVSIFSELGQTVVVKEPMMGPGTSLASCGIAFALKYLDASIQGGVELGFAPEEARAVVMQTMRGALEMMNLNGTMPQTEIDKVTTPGGMTLRGLAAMEESGFTEAVKAGLFNSK
jgi:hypothetical protein